MAVVRLAGVGAAYPGAYIIPVTRDDVENWFEASMINPNPVIAVAAIGLTPILPVMAVVPVVEIPDFARITKSAAALRFTAAGPLMAGVGAGVTVTVGVGVGSGAGEGVGVGVGAGVGAGAGSGVGVGVGTGVIAGVPAFSSTHQPGASLRLPVRLDPTVSRSGKSVIEAALNICWPGVIPETVVLVTSR
jgi:hypothetical protein